MTSYAASEVEVETPPVRRGTESCLLRRASGKHLAVLVAGGLLSSLRFDMSAIPSRIASDLFHLVGAALLVAGLLWVRPRQGEAGRLPLNVAAALVVGRALFDLVDGFAVFGAMPPDRPAGLWLEVVRGALLGTAAVAACSTLESIARRSWWNQTARAWREAMRGVVICCAGMLLVQVLLLLLAVGRGVDLAELRRAPVTTVGLLLLAALPATFVTRAASLTALTGYRARGEGRVPLLARLGTHPFAPVGLFALLLLPAWLRLPFVLGLL